MTGSVLARFEIAGRLFDLACVDGLFAVPGAVHHRSGTGRRRYAARNGLVTLFLKNHTISA
jgi:hypothetical protein